MYFLVELICEEGISKKKLALTTWSSSQQIIECLSMTSNKSILKYQFFE